MLTEKLVLSAAALLQLGLVAPALAMVLPETQLSCTIPLSLFGPDVVDPKGFKAQNTMTCADECNKLEECIAYAFKLPKNDGAMGNCWLKSAVDL